jgi:hypothetical protein
MKLKIKLAREYAKNPAGLLNEEEIIACYHGYLAGFEKALELASGIASREAKIEKEIFEFDLPKGFSSPIYRSEKIAMQIGHLGEEEVKE